MAGVVEFFLRDTTPRRPAPPAHGAPEAIVVLAPAGLIDAASHAVAGAALGRGGHRSVLVCRWCADARPLPRPLLGGPAGRVVRRLQAHGFDAVARRRSTIVALPVEAGEVLGAVEQVCRWAEPGPLVIALGGPRPPVLDGMVAAADAVIVARSQSGDAEIAQLALLRAAAPGRRGGTLVLPASAGPAARLASGATRRAAAVLLATPAGPRTGSAGEVVHAH